jgi:pyruvate formate lyase activating enzyme
MDVRAHPARLWKPLADAAVQCRLCSHFCVIPPACRGRCGVRENRAGELFSLVYGLPAAINVDPVEKKPLYHFLPCTPTFSFGTMGCNMSCVFCQNATLSQPPRLGQRVSGHLAEPADLVAAALEHGCKSISYTYSEPTVFFELVEDTARLARARGLKNVLVTNGFMSAECLEAFGPAESGLIQAANVDVKAFSELFYHERCGASLAPVMRNLKRMRELGWWIETTTLLIPGLNDDPAELRDLAGFLASELGPDTPWHISRFHPDYQLLDRPATPQESLAAARDIGRAAGLRFVYVGNASGPGFGDTVCPACSAVVIRREGFRCAPGGVKDGACRACGAGLPGVWG